MFPLDRDWSCNADFRGHLQTYFQEGGYERILEIVGSTAREIIATDPAILQPTFEEYTRNTPMSERVKLIWQDPASIAFLRRVYIAAGVEARRRHMLVNTKILYSTHLCPSSLCRVAAVSA